MSPNTKRTPKQLPSRYVKITPAQDYVPRQKAPSRRDRRRMLVRARKTLEGK